MGRKSKRSRQAQCVEAIDLLLELAPTDFGAVLSDRGFSAEELSRFSPLPVLAEALAAKLFGRSSAVEPLKRWRVYVGTDGQGQSFAFVAGEEMPDERYTLVFQQADDERTAELWAREIARSILLWPDGTARDLPEETEEYHDAAD